ncbi:MAG: YsnF/AvaK domain-containing protein [Gloeocapsa sp. UFS-A4-WI-NPMV-4B04]|jgi:hypothetical protein|nr:YsnF/AvaK domain-containing protein [Gloeocapsa sp. UFS-A4-WI-NPMV-4B04]
MNNETSRQQLESIKETAQINRSVEKLRIKLKNFTVIDRQSETVGAVQDIILGTNRQINFVISQNYNAQSSRQFLLISKLVQKVDPSNRSVIVDISKSEIDALPEYVKQETPGMETPELPDNAETPADEAADKDITIDSDFYPSVMPAASVDTFNLDTLEMGSTSDLSLDEIDISEEDITIDSDFYSSEIPPKTNAEVDIDALFNLASGETVLTSDVGLADTQQRDDLINSDTSEVLEEELIRLLGERLIVGRSKRKVGEVIVRKEIETRMIQVPVRREKLIIEQVSPEHKQLAEIDLGEEEISGVDLTAAEISGNKMPVARADNELTVTGEFSSPKIASLLLNAIALERRQGCKKVRLEIVVEDVERQKSYQEWVDRASGNTPSSNV